MQQPHQDNGDNLSTKKLKRVKYKMLDGKIFEATTPLDLIQQMRADSLNPEATQKEYMVSVSKSAYEYNHSNINIDTPEHFVEDLIENGFVEVV